MRLPGGQRSNSTSASIIRSPGHGVHLGEVAVRGDLGDVGCCDSGQLQLSGGRDYRSLRYSQLRCNALTWAGSSMGGTPRCGQMSSSATTPSGAPRTDTSDPVPRLIFPEGHQNFGSRRHCQPDHLSRAYQPATARAAHVEPAPRSLRTSLYRNVSFVSGQYWLVHDPSAKNPYGFVTGVASYAATSSRGRVCAGEPGSLVGTVPNLPGVP